MDPEAPRVRAWVFFNPTDPDRAAREIAVHFPDGEAKWIIVRADVVEGDPNLVVPVDAASKEALEEALVILRRAAGAEKSVALVEKHHPEPPHLASLYLTDVEYDFDKPPEYDGPGRHPHSPGANPWG